MEDNSRKVCLFDLDGTLADHDGALIRDMNYIMSPNEPPFVREDKELPHIHARMNLIRSQRNWWFDLKVLPLGFDLYEMSRKIGFQTHVLTKGPWSTPHGWSEKVLWVKKHLYDDTKICITEDKSLVYGRVLVDDYPPYVDNWLKYRPRGLVIMPVHYYNKDYKHPQVISFNGNNRQEVYDALVLAYAR